MMAKEVFGRVQTSIEAIMCTKNILIGWFQGAPRLNLGITFEKCVMTKRPKMKSVYSNKAREIRILQEEKGKEKFTRRKGIV